MATLLVLLGPKRGVRLTVAEPVTVGRSSQSTLQLVDGKVSREHCVFELRGSTLWLCDRGSGNGTFVNGQRVEGERALADGDAIAIGDSLLLAGEGHDAAVARFGDATLVVANEGEPGADAGRRAAGAGGAGGAGREGAARPAAARAATARAAQRPVAEVVRLATALDGAVGLEAGARAMLASVERALRPERAFVLLGGADGSAPRPLVGSAPDAVVSVSRTLLARAAESGQVVTFTDASREARRALSVVKHGLRCVAVAPLLVEGRVAGFVHVDRASPPWDDAAVAELEVLTRVFALHGAVRPRPLPARAAGATVGSGDGTVAAADAGAATIPAETPVARSAALQQALRTALAAARGQATVLITGETGTGKEEIARHVHRCGPRARGPFVAVNCGAIPESLAESTLFGHDKGAFTGAIAAAEGQIEAADGGTLFLDEIGELSPAVQAKLLRVVQERVVHRVGSTVARRVDVHLLTATHRDLEAAVRAGRFREDLYYRLNVIRIHLPPLRERPEDIDGLAVVLLARAAAGLGRPAPEFERGALAALRRWPWPGNARELGNLVERLLVLRDWDDGGPITAAEIGTALGEAPRPQAMADAGASLADKVAALERVEIEQALRRARGVKTRAARALGISRPTLDKKIADLAIDLFADPSAEAESG